MDKGLFIHNKYILLILNDFLGLAFLEDALHYLC